MGMTFDEILKTTFCEYQKKWLAWQYKKTYENDLLRRLETTIFNFGGMGAKDSIEPSKWLNLGLIDKEDELLPIRTKQQALEIFKEIVN